MKPTKQITNYVIAEIAGEDVLQLVEYLKGKENVSEFIIAADLEIEINIIRNMLYRLLDANLVSFSRKKDKQKGWYIYYWTYEPNNISHLYWEIKKKRLDSLKERRRRETQNVFFTCPSGCIRLDFDKAVTFGYQCPECGTVLEQQDNSQTVLQLEQEIGDIEKELTTRHTIQSKPVVAPAPVAVKKKVVVKKKVATKKTPTKKKVTSKK